MHTLNYLSDWRGEKKAFRRGLLIAVRRMNGTLPSRSNDSSSTITKYEKSSCLFCNDWFDSQTFTVSLIVEITNTATNCYENYTFLKSHNLCYLQLKSAYERWKRVTWSASRSFLHSFFRVTLLMYCVSRSELNGLTWILNPFFSGFLCIMKPKANQSLYGFIFLAKEEIKIYFS